MTEYRLPLFDKLEPRKPWTGGRLADTDVLNLEDAALFASKQAGNEITAADILRAAARGEIPLRAVCRRTVTMQPCRATDEPLTVPEGSIPTLPLDACQSLSSTGRATWRTFESHETADAFAGELCRFTRWQLADTEPALVTIQNECRVTGYDVHALADAFANDEAKPNRFPNTAPAVAPETVHPLGHLYRLQFPSDKLGVSVVEAVELTASVMPCDSANENATYLMTRRLLVVRDHKRLLFKAIKSGQVIPREPSTGTTPNVAQFDWYQDDVRDGWMLTVPEFRKFCDSIAIELVAQDAIAPAFVANERIGNGAAHEEEPTAQRQERRYKMCIDAGLEMPTNDYAPMPRGIGAVAEQENITRQAFVEDVKKHINRLNAK